MCLKYANRLTDEQLKEIYQLFLCEDFAEIINRFGTDYALDFLFNYLLAN